MAKIKGPRSFALRRTSLLMKKYIKNILSHEKIENLKGLEVEFIYEWEMGSMLIFDRSHIHCSSSVIDGKKIGIATFTKK